MSTFFQRLIDGGTRTLADARASAVPYRYHVLGQVDSPSAAAPAVESLAHPSDPEFASISTPVPQPSPRPAGGFRQDTVTPSGSTPEDAVVFERGETAGGHEGHIACSPGSDAQVECKTAIARPDETRAFSLRDAGIRDLEPSSAALDARLETDTGRTADRQLDATRDVTLEQMMRALRSRLLTSHPPGMSPRGEHTADNASHLGPSSTDVTTATSPTATVSPMLPRVSAPVSLSRGDHDGSGDVERRLSTPSRANKADHRSEQLVVEKLDIRIIPPPHEPRREPVVPPAPRQQAGAWSAAARYYISRV